MGMNGGLKGRRDVLSTEGHQRGLFLGIMCFEIGVFANSVGDLEYN